MCTHVLCRSNHVNETQLLSIKPFLILDLFYGLEYGIIILIKFNMLFKFQDWLRKSLKPFYLQTAELISLLFVAFD